MSRSKRRRGVSLPTPKASYGGFTLIELLIVIAIIIILLLIALPNFLEAHVRAKVTKAKGDLRSTATAVEAYQADQLKYPWPAHITSLNVPAFPPADPTDLHVPAAVTTPVAYITALPSETFYNLSDQGPDFGEGKQFPFHYGNDVSNAFFGAPNLIPDLTFRLFGQPRHTEYYLVSHGPDSDRDDFGGQEGTPVYFNPTNGAISNGDIYFFGSGIGFEN